jgi:hypothetical protein
MVHLGLISQYLIYLENKLDSSRKDFTILDLSRK